MTASPDRDDWLAELLTPENPPTAPSPTPAARPSAGTPPASGVQPILANPAARAEQSQRPVRRLHALGPGTRVATERPRGTVLSLGVTGGSLLAAAAVFTALAMLFPWLNPLTGDDADPTGASDTVPAAQARTVGTGGPTPAEGVVEGLINADLPGFGTWDTQRRNASITAPSLGFGCDPKDGLSPTVARSRTYSDETGRETVSVSARAYPAGGGAVALDGITQATDRCEDAWTSTPGVDVGIEAVHVESRRVAALVWRRGDVLVTAAVTTAGRAGSPSAHTDALRHLDEVLTEQLRTTCANPDAPAEAAARSPYLNRRNYAGHHKGEKIHRPASSRLPAEETAAAPIVAIPAPAVEQPYAPERPTPPNPLPTAGPTALPTEVLPATQPDAPTKPRLVAEVKRAIADTVGPGCGWAFTGQQAPNFDAEHADAVFDENVAQAQVRLDRKWNRWQDAKIAYWRAYEQYQTRAAAYLDYLAALEQVAVAWQVIEDARADYYTALADYEQARETLKQWRKDRRKARAEYQAALAECRDLAANPPTTNPTGNPTGSPTSDPTTSPTTGPNPSPTTGPNPATPNQPVQPTQPAAPEAPQCPPERPDILDEAPPTVPSSPVPAPEAQLPTPN